MNGYTIALIAAGAFIAGIFFGRWELRAEIDRELRKLKNSAEA